MIDAKQLEIEGEIREVYWVGDPAIDVESSDIEAWIRDGSGLLVRPREEASVVKWRPLGDRERFAASANARKNTKPIGSDFDANLNAAYQWECARFGLVSISGMSFGWDHFYGVKGLSDETMRQLARMKIKESPTDVALTKAAGVRFLMWLGGLIVEASFRDGD